MTLQKPAFYSILALVLALASSLIVFGATPKANKAAEKKPAKIDASDKLFSSSELLHISIEIPPEGMTVLEKYQWQFGPQAERESVKATIREGDKVYKDVALHLKGAAGSFRSVLENPALTLNFDKHADGQKFHGLTKLSLNNSVQDPTLVSEQFSRELFLKAGVPTPRATHAVVELNGRDLGVYVLVEGFNKQFLKRHFKDASGNLYDGGFLKDVNQELALNVGENPKEQSDRAALADAAAEPDLAKRRERLEKVLDIDRFLTYVALDIMLWDWDGYAQNKNNWRLYHDPSTGKNVFMPHGLDQLFWKPEGSLLPPMQGLVAKAVLQVPEWRTRYFEKVKQLRGTVFKPEVLTNRVTEIASKVSPTLKKKDQSAAREQEKAVADFCAAIARRARSIDEQLATPIQPASFASGAATLTRWESKAAFGHPAMDKAAADGKQALHLTTSAGSSIGSWRSKIWLEEGRYRVEGRVKTRELVPDVGDTRGGAGLRLGNSRPANYVKATSDWTTVNHEFSVSDPLTEVEVVCEFRGAEGEAWFESDSIRLTRLPSKKDK